MAVAHGSGSFAGAGGVEIHHESWIDDDAPPRLALVIAHGAGEHVGRYRHLVQRLAPEGVAVHALDHRGHGHSGGRRAVIDRMDHALADLDHHIDAVRSELPLILLGHSLGGCIATEYALRHQAKLDALILSGPAIALEAASPVQRVMARLLSRVAPSLGVLALPTEGISSDPDEVAAYERDPLVHHGRIPVRTLAEAAALVETFEARVPRLTLPLLVIHGAEDPLVPPSGSRMIHERAASADKTLRLYDGLRHELINERLEARGEVLDELVAWLAARFPIGTRRS